MSSFKSITRRDALRGAASFGTAGMLGCGSAAPSSDADRVRLEAGGRPKVAVVGGGAGGIAAAYFLDGTCDVDLFESRSKIGGHCDSHIIDYEGQRITVDLGAQFFHPATHPIYVTLLEELGLYDPDHPDADSTLEAPGSVSIFPIAGGLPTFTSTIALLTPIRAIEFAVYTQLARQAVLGNMSWEVTLEQWIKSLPLSSSFKDSVLYPWISSLIGTTRAEALRSSARSILQTFALAFPSNLLAGASTFNSKIGLEGNLRAMLDRSPGTRVHVGMPVDGLSLDGTSWSLHTPAGLVGPFDAIVMNAPPPVSKGLLAGLPWAADLVSLLDAHTYFDSRLVIHTDAAYVHADRNFWAVYNAGTDGVECEGSVWLGGIHEKLPSGGTTDVFKSWAERRRADPRNILLERRFRHPLITPECIRATRALRPLQGRNGLYFSGQSTTGMDLQEAAVYSAMQVADKLAPSSATLGSLRTRLAARGLSGISYDL